MSVVHSPMEIDTGIFSRYEIDDRPAFEEALAKVEDNVSLTMT